MICADVCGSHSLLIPFVLALPYIWRFAQCLIIAHQKKDFGQVLNAIKYSTALPVVFLRFVKYGVDVGTWRLVWKPLWVMSCVLNTTYSFYWDVERDWDIRMFTPGMLCYFLHRPSHHRSNLLFWRFRHCQRKYLADESVSAPEYRVPQ